MHSFLDELRTQRWDDHRYYHHSRANQALHLVSALSFLSAYAIVFKNPALAAIIAWLFAMTTRQVGHFFFEPKGYDAVNKATHAYKEHIKVGYNLKRKVVLMAIWASSPALLYVAPTLFGVDQPPIGRAETLHHVGVVWLVVGAAGLLFRTIQLFFIKDVRSGLVWITKILTDPFHDVLLYYKAPYYLIRDGFDWRRAPKTLT